MTDIDVNLLFEFEDGHAAGLTFFAMEHEPSEILGRTVDPNTPRFQSPFRRDDVPAEAEDQ